MSIIYFEGFETVGTELGLVNQAIIVPRVDLRFDDTNPGGIPATDSYFLIEDDYSEGYACHMGQSGWSNGNYLEITPSELQVGASGPGTPTVIIGVRVHIPSAARTANILQVYGRYSPVGTDRQFEVAYVDSEDLKLTFGSGLSLRETTETGVFTPNNWHYVEIKFKCSESASGGMIHIKVDGNTIIEQDPQDMNNACSVEAYEYFRFCTTTSSTGNDYTAYDDIYIINADNSPHTTFLGPVRVRSLPPMGDQDTTWVPDSGSVNYTQVDENGADDTDYVEAEYEPSRDIYKITDLVEDYDIYAVKLEAEAKNMTIGEPSITLQVWSGSDTDNEKFIVDNTADYELFTFYNEADPATSLDWAPTAIDSMLAGFIYDNEIG